MNKELQRMCRDVFKGKSEVLSQIQPVWSEVRHKMHKSGQPTSGLRSKPGTHQKQSWSANHLTTTLSLYTLQSLVSCSGKASLKNLKYTTTTNTNILLVPINHNHQNATVNSNINTHSSQYKTAGVSCKSK